jgi:hypothetical protein
VETFILTSVIEDCNKDANLLNIHIVFKDVIKQRHCVCSLFRGANVPYIQQYVCSSWSTSKLAAFSRTSAIKNVDNRLTFCILLCGMICQPIATRRKLKFLISGCCRCSLAKEFN